MNDTGRRLLDAVLPLVKLASHGNRLDRSKYGMTGVRWDVRIGQSKAAVAGLNYCTYHVPN